MLFIIVIIINCIVVIGNSLYLTEPAGSTAPDGGELQTVVQDQPSRARHEFRASESFRTVFGPELDLSGLDVHIFLFLLR